MRKRFGRGRLEAYVIFYLLASLQASRKRPNSRLKNVTLRDEICYKSFSKCLLRKTMLGDAFQYCSQIVAVIYNVCCALYFLFAAVKSNG